MFNKKIIPVKMIDNPSIEKVNKAMLEIYKAEELNALDSIGYNVETFLQICKAKGINRIHKTRSFNADIYEDKTVFFAVDSDTRFALFTIQPDKIEAKE
jgi:hypothetical protein